MPKRPSIALEITSKSAEDTQRLGEQLGLLLAPGDVLALIGELGSGKTTFIQGLAKGLGASPDQVKSPTFVLLREYPGRTPLVHLDGYRLEGSESAVWLDLDWLFSRAKVTVIEWADRLQGCLPEEGVELYFEHKRTNQRGIRAIAHGERARQLIEGWSKQAKPGESAAQPPDEALAHPPGEPAVKPGSDAGSHPA